MGNKNQKPKVKDKDPSIEGRTLHQEPVKRDTQDDLEKRFSELKIEKAATTDQVDANTYIQPVNVPELGSAPKPRSTRTDYIRFPFLLDRDTISYIDRSCVMFILRGLPGSGKSTIVNLLRDTYHDVVVCSADDYFSRNGEYHFDPSGLQYAHKSCQTKATGACQNQVKTVIIDNTNVQRWEMKFYFQLASRCGYTVIIVVPQTPWCLDPYELARRNKHGVNYEIIESKVSKFNKIHPLYFGWFLNKEDTNRVMDQVDKYFPRCCQLFPQLVQKFREFHSNRVAEINFYQLYNQKSSGSHTLHCTSFYGGSGQRKDPGLQSYATSRAVVDAMGQAQAIQIVGITVTSATVGARIRLTSKQLPLWAQDDDEVAAFSGRDVSSASGGHVPKGSRAHLTLGYVQGTEAVRTGLDQLKLIELESGNAAAKCFELEDAYVTYYNEGVCHVEFRSPLEVGAIFSGFY